MLNEQVQGRPWRSEDVSDGDDDMVDRSGIMTEACSADQRYVSSESCGDRVDITDRTSVKLGLQFS